VFSSENKHMKNLIWFRNDLRISDHEPLLEASKKGPYVGLYCFDPRHYENTPYGFPKTDSIRAQFLIECVEDLRSSLKGNVIVRIGKPEEIIPGLIEQYRFRELFYHREATREEIDVESAVKESVSVPVSDYWGGTMYHPDDLQLTESDMPDVFSHFRKIAEKKSRVRDPLPKPTVSDTDAGIDYGPIPTPEDLGLAPKMIDERSVLPFKGGESAALNRLQTYFFDQDLLRDYKFTRNGLLGADYSSKFSPWLAHGAISARTIHDQVVKYESDIHKNVSTYWMKFELLWRDYFRFSAVKYGDKIFRLGGIQQKELKKREDPEVFWQWANGLTGIPFIDANMRELIESGFMSNRGRQNVASFLAQNLDFDWRWGAAWFESRLVDYDVCSNWGNWGYNAAVGHDPRNRYFNILKQADDYDKKGEYVRHWLPELRNVPKEFVHQPHLMSSDQQQLFDCVIGRDYPEPMINLEKSYERIRES